MTLKEFYKSLGSDYNTVVMRMGGSEKLLDKFVRKLPNDKSAEQLSEALEKGDCELAFRMAHTLKGLSANLGLDRLQNASSELTEALRNQENIPDNARELAKNVMDEYEKVISALEQLDQSGFAPIT
ncbi:MAG: Hpt domain-containing protein [Oscillospiraceae bacterium]|nr:Hpt domain-containing protein [Oscillospiraceae bacterium]